MMICQWIVVIVAVNTGGPRCSGDGAIETTTAETTDPEETTDSDYDDTTSDPDETTGRICSLLLVIITILSHLYQGRT